LDDGGERRRRDLVLYASSSSPTLSHSLTTFHKAWEMGRVIFSSVYLVNLRMDGQYYEVKKISRHFLSPHTTTATTSSSHPLCECS